MRHRTSRKRVGALLAGALTAAIVVLAGCSADTHVDIDVPPQTDVALAEETVQQLQDAVTAAMTASGSSGAIVGVWAPWSGSWVAALGTQTPGGAPVTTDMTFPATKMTRAMTCDVLYALAERGTVALDDSVDEYVSGVPALADVTLEQLCDSTSGLGSYTPHLFGTWVQNPERAWKPRELASFGIGKERDSEAGAAYLDSDAGYVLLGLALERAAGMTAAELIAEHVVDPLDLDATALEATPSDAVRLTGLHSRTLEGGGRDCAEPLDVTETSLSIGFTDSGVLTDIDDLGRYAQALASGALVPDDAERFADPLAPSSGALSWNMRAGGAVLAGSLIGQAGALPGYITAAFSDPDTGLTVALVLNNSAASGSVGTYLAWELAAIASKAPAVAGESAPAAGLPWTAEQQHAAIAERAICAAPAE
ncbi:serine hydrolase domain-containing protein [Microbacterium sp. 2FI]|uniref:serine hydrolase domain-containing protein n=1 Tax=Microbacterium sp. 2FI TaxID=2502193 RepID=UPI0010F9E7DB|nr:serine hydrolase domain-containing protein [Microbacterium sp. 2FI]